MHYLSSTIKGLLCTALCVVSCTRSEYADKKQDFTDKNHDQSELSAKAEPESVADLGQTDITTVRIGNQKWTTKNLNVSTFRNGDVIPQAKTKGEWKAFDETGEPAWCYYENNPANGEKYGKLYNWYAVHDPRGLAPRGFHVPSDGEWTVLTDYLDGEWRGGSKIIYYIQMRISDFLGGEWNGGSKMKTKVGWNKEGNGTNSSGFSGLPGGWRGNEGTFYDVVGIGGWWSSSEFDSTSAWYRYLYYYEGKVFRHDGSKGRGLSVRCLLD